MFDTYEEILTVNELQDILFISRNTAYSLLRNGRIHSFKIGNTWRIPKNAIEEFVGYKPNENSKRFSV